VFSVLYFAANACVVYYYLSSHAQTALLAGVGTSKCTLGWGGGWNQFEADLRRWSVDYSAATPFKLALFFAWLCYSCTRSLFGRIPYREFFERYRALPFFDSLETTFVQLGLAGTIWGFLLIGWRIGRTLHGGGETQGDGGFGISPTGLQGAETQSALQILLDAFGTALVSTFTGVMLAFVAAPLIRHLWRWLHALSRPVTVLQPTITAVSEALRANVDPTNRLRDALGEVSRTLSDGRYLDAFRTNLKEAIDLLGTISTRLGDLSGSSRKMRVALTRADRQANRVDAALQRIERGVDKISAILAANAQIAAVQQQLLRALQEQNRQQTEANDYLKRMVVALDVLPPLRQAAESQIDRDANTKEALDQVAADLRRLNGTSDKLLDLMNRPPVIAYSGERPPSLIDQFLARFSRRR
jgi:hypothetical protein